jgi:hypothetical protein
LLSSIAPLGDCTNGCLACILETSSSERSGKTNV